MGWGGREAQEGESEVKVLVAHTCLTLWDPMDCSPPGSSVHGDFPGKNTGVGAIPFSRGFPRIEPGSPAFCRQISVPTEPPETPSKGRGHVSTCG